MAVHSASSLKLPDCASPWNYVGPLQVSIEIGSNFGLLRVPSALLIPGQSQVETRWHLTAPPPQCLQEQPVNILFQMHLLEYLELLLKPQIPEQAFILPNSLLSA